MNSVPHKLSWIQESENRKVRSQHLLSDVSRLSTLDVDQTHPGIFSKFISCLTWFPRLSNVLLVSSRGGDISLVKLRSKTCHSLCTGRGRGAAITEIKCDYWDHNWFFTSSICGKIIKRHVHSLEEIVLKDSYKHENDENYGARFACLDTNSFYKLLISGDNNGVAHLISTSSSSELNATLKLHSSHILHCEFHPKCSELLVTASIDGSTKLWDIRMMKTISKANQFVNPIKVLKHDNSLNCATFSPNTDSALLLVHDFYDQIHIYVGPFWLPQRIINHNHKQLQRFSLIKAHWHPSVDMFVIASSNGSDCPDNSYNGHGIDFIDANQGSILSSFSDISLTSVAPINKFNCSGDVVASARGRDLVILNSYPNQ